jgi:hypothetical protein
VNFLMVEIPPLSHIYLWSGWIDKWNSPRVEPWGHPHPLPEVFFIAEYKTRLNDFDLQLVLVSCPKGQVKKNVNVETCGKHL